MNREDQAPARASSQVSKDTALLLYKSNFWSELSARQIAEFQMGQERLCMPFEVFHKATEETLGRPVWTHEFAWARNLQKEMAGEKEPPSLDEIMELIPEEKRIVIEV